MKPYRFCLLLLLVITACRKDPGSHMEDVYRANEKKVTITQGVRGTVSFAEGDFMPGHVTGKIYPVQRTVCIYEPTSDSQLISHDHPQSTFFDTITSRLITKVESDGDGFFQTELPSGKYTMVVIEEGRYYANSWSDYLNPFTVVAGNATKADFFISYKATY